MLFRSYLGTAAVLALTREHGVIVLGAALLRMAGWRALLLAPLLALPVEFPERLATPLHGLPIFAGRADPPNYLLELRRPERDAILAAWSAGDGWTVQLSNLRHMLERSGRQGHAQAQYNLGVMYAKGEGVVQSRERAAEWWTRAAELGLASRLRCFRDLDDPALPERFDTIVCLDVLEHLSDPAAQLELFARRLQPSGIALLNWYFFKGHNGEYPFHFDDPQLVEAFFRTLQSRFLEVFHPYLITTRAYRLA